MARKKSLTRGISLIEVLIAVSLSAFVLIGILSLFISGQQYIISQDARIDAIEESRNPLELMARDIKEAIEVVPGPMTIDGNSYSTSPNCLVLKIPSIDINGYIIDIDNEFDYVAYFLNSNFQDRLDRAQDGKDGVSTRADRTRPIAERIQNFSLTYLDKDGSAAGTYSDTVLIDVYLRAVRRGTNQFHKEKTNTRVKLRNKLIS
jgi:type II secretory pathway component PulJ